MKVGTICYATSRGLGHLAHDFYLNGVITDVLVMRHRSIPMNADWYPRSFVINGTPGEFEVACNFAKGMDALLFFETPFYWELIHWAKSQSIRTYLVTMYECHPRKAYYGVSGIGPFAPHRYLCPSKLDMVYFPTGTEVFLPVEYPWKQRERAEHFVHNGGYLGIRGREGTENLIEAMSQVKSSIRLTIRVQENVSPRSQRLAAADPRIEYIAQQVPYEELYATGDVCVGAQKWNGCSLPLQEAFASGMMVMNTNRFPMNTWLPNEPLIPVENYTKSRISGAYLEFEEAIVSPKRIAETIDFWYGKDISSFSLQGKEWAEKNSWSVLKPVWMEVLSK